MALSTYTKFQNSTKFDIAKFFDECQIFFNYKYPLLVDYYTGESQSIDSSIIDSLSTLEINSNNLSSVFITNKNKLKTTDFFDLQLTHEEIKTKIKTCRNLSKWLRSYKLNSSFVNTTTLSKTSGKLQTLSDLITDSVGDIGEEEVNKTIVLNNIKESSWSVADGNKEIKILTNRISNDSEVTTFFDNPIGENIFGKDISRKISLASDDIVELAPQETLNQTLNILMSLTKSDMFYNPRIGLSKDSIIGLNSNIIQYRKILNDLSDIFSTDDLFDFVSIQDLSYENGDIKVTCIISIKLSTEIVITTTL